ncbi:hypothetical protein KP509_21G049400 [Ceratopteris richardii]|nr:hypothetical protein KP509_21G049400 [Ceratopteris richardii]
MFLVDPHMLEHWILQDLLLKDIDGEYSIYTKMRGSKQGLNQPIFLNCDAILFEFFLWLIMNDDPTLRDLNLGDLMEFYGSEF